MSDALFDLAVDQSPPSLVVTWRAIEAICEANGHKLLHLVIESDDRRITIDAPEAYL